MSKYKLQPYNKSNLQKHMTMRQQALARNASDKEMKELFLHIFLGTTDEEKYVDNYIECLVQEVQQKCIDNNKIMHIKHINRNRNDPKLDRLSDEAIPNYAVVDSYSNQTKEQFITLEEAVQYCKSNGYVLEYK